ncbi:uncharacterized protein LOC110215317 [Phascolarctos cinereus]|uniref:Uncharacterized protein LOC110215317 n=1 Tax=Phascolarctos cinereus TaxID=38626 RepID=A0A6P5L6G2_PHACI|nr:uncharacterized protein LOC110215317 [Phascolarctos cinereus]
MQPGQTGESQQRDHPALRGMGISPEPRGFHAVSRPPPLFPQHVAHSGRWMTLSQTVPRTPSPCVSVSMSGQAVPASLIRSLSLYLPESRAPGVPGGAVRRRRRREGWARWPRKPERRWEGTPELRSQRITHPPETSRQPGTAAAASMGAEHQARACLASCGPATPPALRELLRMLQRFAGASGRRCQEQSLADTGRLLPALSQAWAELGAAEAQPFLRCLLSCQLEAMGSLGAFRKLEKIVATLAASRESMVSEEVARMLGSLTQGQQERPGLLGASSRPLGSWV